MISTKLYLFIILILSNLLLIANTQRDTIKYNLVIEKGTVNITGKETNGMLVNGSIPGPTLIFTEGDFAVITVTNKMNVETSVHWHGLILPSFYDGVPYLSTPPIKASSSFTYTFEINQAGTYWYHSHTMLQEQSGVYGSIVIKPKKKKFDYDKELVIVLSDWTNQKPLNVLRNLKRGNEYYGIKKGTSVPLNRVIANNAFMAQLIFWKQRMEGADIADVYYDAFLSNGEQAPEYKDFKPGEKVRLRIINGSASSQFWLTFSDKNTTLISSDGVNVVPVKRDKQFIAIAETYDFLITVPQNKQLEVRATAQDGSGFSQTFIGNGVKDTAEILPRPNKIKMMKMISKMDMKMGAPAMKFGNKENPEEMKAKWGMQMNNKMEGHMNHTMDMESEMKNDNNMDMYSEYSYDFLHSDTVTSLSDSAPKRKLLFNLTGNMWRYIWSINGVSLANTDKIKIKKGEVVQITLNNLTMMHHPMHLHGHFFRVINKHGEKSPLKHTVNIPPMGKTTIEFAASESGDWFFHCHVLYHMMSGMARAFSYESFNEPRMEKYSFKKVKKESAIFYQWATISAGSNLNEFMFVSSNTRNMFVAKGEVGWNNQYESEVTYQYFLQDYVSVFGGVNAEKEPNDNFSKSTVVAVAGVKFLSPYMFNVDIRLDNLLRPQVSLDREILVFPRTILFGYYEYRADFGLVNKLTDKNGNQINYADETVWGSGVSYILNRNIRVKASYDNRFGFGGRIEMIF